MPMPDDEYQQVKDYFAITLSAGGVLVLFPSLALVFGMDTFQQHATFGYPILAIFGIMILLGALALVTTLFARLNLAAPAEALALPPGSIRATVALSLIVLFALLSVVLYRSLCEGEPVVLKGLGEAAKQQLVSDPSNTDVRVTPVPCPAAAAAASAASNAAHAADACSNGALFKFDVQIGGRGASSSAIDFAKQLLTLIGTLMTAVVSFYFASKSAESVAAKTVASMTDKGPGTDAPKPAPPVGADEHDHEHGGVITPTADKDLPAAQGGVGPKDQ
jgi:hypothetical protein